MPLHRRYFQLRCGYISVIILKVIRTSRNSASLNNLNYPTNHPTNRFKKDLETHGEGPT